MLNRKAFVLRTTIRFAVGLALVCGIGWFTDRTGWSTWVRSCIDVIVIGIVLGLLFPGPLFYRAYVDREQQRGNQ
jgi:hypothetical protein